MKTVSVEFKPGEPAKIIVATCQAVLEEIREADFSKAKVAYFGWMDETGFIRTASHADSTAELIGILQMQVAGLTAEMLGIPRMRDLEIDGDDEEEDEDDA